MIRQEDNGGSADATLIAIAVVEHAGGFLIGQRPEGVALAGLWEFPGGKVRAGEDPAAAAVRECLEETGLDVTVRGEYPANEETYAHGRVALRFFDCVPCDEAQMPLAPFRWVARSELERYEFPSGNRTLLEILKGEGRRSARSR